MAGKEGQQSQGNFQTPEQRRMIKNRFDHRLRVAKDIIEALHWPPEANYRVLRAIYGSKPPADRH